MIDNLAANPIAILPEPAERIRLRKAFGIAQIRLAAEMKVSRKTIWEWETGNSEPTGDNRERYARILALWNTRERESKSE